MKAGMDGYILNFIVFADVHIHSLNGCFIIYGFDTQEIRLTRKGMAGQEWNMPYLKYKETQTTTKCDPWLNTLRLRQERHFVDDIFKCIFFNENITLSMKMSPRVVSQGPLDNTSSLVEVMARHRTGDKPLPKSMMTQITDAYRPHTAAMCGIKVLCTQHIHAIVRQKARNVLLNRMFVIHTYTAKSYGTWFYVIRWENLYGYFMYTYLVIH